MSHLPCSTSINQNSASLILDPSAFLLIQSLDITDSMFFQTPSKTQQVERITWFFMESMSRNVPFRKVLKVRVGSFPASAVCWLIVGTWKTFTPDKLASLCLLQDGSTRTPKETSINYYVPKSLYHHMKSPDKGLEKGTSREITMFIRTQ